MFVFILITMLCFYTMYANKKYNKVIIITILAEISDVNALVSCSCVLCSKSLFVIIIQIEM